MNKTNEGTLMVRVFTACGGLPVPGANVRITGTNEGSADVNYSLVTGRNGLAGPVSLPAPAVSVSISPSPETEPYYTYDVEISADGYYRKIVRDLPMFSGISTSLPVNMFPLSEYSSDTQSPSSSLNTIITENGELR